MNACAVVNGLSHWLEPCKEQNWQIRDKEVQGRRIGMNIWEWTQNMRNLPFNVSIIRKHPLSKSHKTTKCGGCLVQ